MPKGLYVPFKRKKKEERVTRDINNNWNKWFWVLLKKNIINLVTFFPNNNYLILPGLKVQNQFRVVFLSPGSPSRKSITSYKAPVGGGKFWILVCKSHMAARQMQRRILSILASPKQHTSITIRGSIPTFLLVSLCLKV